MWTITRITMIETKRLTIQEVDIDKDLEDIKESLKDPFIQDNVYGIPPIKDVEDWLVNNNAMILIARTKDTNEFIGLITVTIFSTTADIGGWCVNKNRKQNYAKEVYTSISKTLFENTIHKITATCIKDNLLARILLESLKFDHIATLKEHAILNGRFVDIMLFERFNEPR